MEYKITKFYVTQVAFVNSAQVLTELIVLVENESEGKIDMQGRLCKQSTRSIRRWRIRILPNLTSLLQKFSLFSTAIPHRPKAREQSKLCKYHQRHVIMFKNLAAYACSHVQVFGSVPAMLTLICSIIGSGRSGPPVVLL